MNRRSFFSRTIGAALAGFTAPLAVRKTGITHWILNPEWLTAPIEVKWNYGYYHLDGTPTKVPSYVRGNNGEIYHRGTFTRL